VREGQPEAITRTEAERLLGAHPQQIKRLIDKGWIETFEAGGRTWIVREGLEEKWKNRPLQKIRPKKPKPPPPPAAPPTPKAESPTPSAPAPEPLEPRAPSPRGRRATRVAATAPAAGPADPGALLAYGFPEIPKPGTVPNLEEQKAWTEFNKRFTTHLQLFKDAGILVFKDDYDKAQNAVIQEIIRQGDILPRIIQQRIPKLTVEDMEEIEDIVREMFSAVASANFEELEDE
jgi:hypothetical protein